MESFMTCESKLFKEIYLFSRLTMTFDIKTGLREIRGAIITLNNKEKSHNENIRGSSVNINDLHKQRSDLLDEYIRLYRKWFKGKYHNTR